MAILDKLSKATQDVVRGAKDITDTARQNSMIADEQKRIANLYPQIGKLYYETQQHDPETPLGQLCLAVTASFERIEKHNEEIRRIKGSRRCPNCANDLPLDATFCGTCGTKLEAIEAPSPESDRKFCSSCGKEQDGSSAFCSSCGQKQ